MISKQVIENTIKKDLEKASQAVTAKEKELRAERLKLIKIKIRETQGSNVDLNVENGMYNSAPYVYNRIPCVLEMCAELNSMNIIVVQKWIWERKANRRLEMLV